MKRFRGKYTSKIHSRQFARILRVISTKNKAINLFIELDFSLLVITIVKFTRNCFIGLGHIFSLPGSRLSRRQPLVCIKDEAFKIAQTWDHLFNLTNASPKTTAFFGT